MKKLSLLSLLFILSKGWSQPPNLSGHIQASISSCVFKYENCFLNNTCLNNRDKVNAEIPPWIIGGGWRSYFFVNGNTTNIFSSPASIISSSEIDIKNNAVGPYLAALPYRLESGFVASNHIKNWKRNYHGIYSAHYIAHPTNGGVSLGFTHSENKNEVSGSCASGTKLQNTIQLNVPIDCNNHDTYSGGSPYQDGWLAYNGILNAVWTLNNQSTNWGQQLFENELGPIAWPVTGYITPTGIKATSGLRHPSSIISGDYIYIYYVDAGPYGNNVPLEEGRGEGIRVLRVHRDLSLNPSQYEVYYKDINGNSTWVPSLPAGFTKDNMLSYVAVKGPKSTDILNDVSQSCQSIRFSVAKIRNSTYYVGVEQYIDYLDGNKFKVAIRFSPDLVTWGARDRIIYSSNTWEESAMNYPIFLDKQGWNNTEVDFDDFYVLGTEHTPQKKVNKIRIYQYVAPPPPPPPSPEPCPPGVICDKEEPFSASKTKTAKVTSEPGLTDQHESVDIFPTLIENGYFTLQVRSDKFENNRQASVRILHVDGRVEKVTNLIFKGQSIVVNVSDLKSGFYLVEFVSSSKRVVKKVYIK